MYGSFFTSFPLSFTLKANKFFFISVFASTIRLNILFFEVEFLSKSFLSLFCSVKYLYLCYAIFFKIKRIFLLPNSLYLLKLSGSFTIIIFLSWSSIPDIEYIIFITWFCFLHSFAQPFSLVRNIYICGIII